MRVFLVIRSLKTRPSDLIAYHARYQIYFKRFQIINASSRSGVAQRRAFFFSLTIRRYFGNNELASTLYSALCDKSVRIQHLELVHLYSKAND